MPRRILMSTLVTRAKQRADREADGHISDAEWKTLISEQYGELYETVADAGLRYFETSSTFTADGSISYQEPDDHLGTITISRVIDTSGRECDLRELAPQEEQLYRSLTGDAACFTLVDDQIFLYPRPSSGSYTVRYIPQAPDLSVVTDDTSIDLVNTAGESFLLWGVTVKAKAKSDEDPQLAMAEREAARARLTEWAAQRAFLQPRIRYVDDTLDAVDPADWRFR